jgi:hypothetical protein
MIDVIVDGIVVVCFNIIVVNLVKRDVTVEVIVVVDRIVVTALFIGINEVDTSPKLERILGDSILAEETIAIITVKTLFKKIKYWKKSVSNK